MRFVVWLRSLWANVMRREDVERSMDAEIRAYVDLLAAEYERSGMSAYAARRHALIDTGGIEQVKEATRDAWVGDAIASPMRELRYALRTLRRSPAFLVVAIVVLALGIGGATAVFTVINASLLRPLGGVADPTSLVTVERRQSGHASEVLSYPDYRDLRDRTTALSGLAAYNGTSMALKDAAGSTRVWVGYVSDNFFALLGVQPAAGRLFEPADARVADANQFVVVSDDLWRRRYAGSPSVIGSTLELDGHRYVVAGIAPRGFIGAMKLHRMEVWIPFAMGGQPSPIANGLRLASRRDSWLRLVGRLRAGATVVEAQHDLASIAAGLAATYATNRDRTVDVFAGAGMAAEEREEVSRMPRLLALAVGLLLLIACGNVAGLSLVRAASRTRELATRLALGASRATLIRQVALEGAVIATGAGVVGVAIAWALVHSATVVYTISLMTDAEVRIDLRVLGVTLFASAVTAVLVSLVPARQLFHVSPAAVLKDGGGAVRRSMSRGQRLVVAAQVAASLVLLSGAGVIFSTFERILAAHDDLDPGGITFGLVDIDPSIPDTAKQLAFYRTLLARASAEQGIAHVALTSSVPPLPWSNKATVFRRGEEPTREALVGHELELGLRVNAVDISSDFFDVMRIPLLRGRKFTPSDNDRSEHVAIVSRTLADELWPGEDPIGQLVSWPSIEGPPRPPLRVIGLVGDTRDLALASAAPAAMYVPFAQDAGANLVLVLRGRADAPVRPATLKRLVNAVDPQVPMLSPRTLRAELGVQLRPQRTASAWIGVFGVIALLLAAIGLYGVIAQTVLQRTRELAVRCALGASPRNILTMVLAEGMRLVALATVVGALGAVAAFRVLQSLFAGLQVVDQLAIFAAAAVLLVAMLTACVVPAYRAARLNPVDALRSD